MKCKWEKVKRMLSVCLGTKLKLSKKKLSLKKKQKLLLAENYESQVM